MSILIIKDLKKNFANTEALKGISLTVAKGDIFGFLGPNGAGKSTTLRCIMDFIRPTSGSITIFQKDSTQSAPELKERTSYVPAEPNLYQSWTVDEHINFTASLQKTDRKKAEELKQKLSLDGKKKVGQLSTGNQQKVALILALITEPDLILLDEPTRGLDPILRVTLHQILKDYQKSGGTILLSSHDLLEVEELCNKVAIIKDGLLIEDRTLQNLKKSKVHKVRLSYSGKEPSLKNLEVEDLIKNGKTINFTIKGDLNPLLKQLASYDIKDLEINTATLEDIFLEIYN